VGKRGQGHTRAPRGQLNPNKRDINCLEDYGWGACLRGGPFFKHPGQTARGPFVLGRKQQNNMPKTSKQHAENIKTTRRKHQNNTPKHQNNTPKTSKQPAKTSKQPAKTSKNIKTTRQNIKNNT